MAGICNKLEVPEDTGTGWKKKHVDDETERTSSYTLLPKCHVGGRGTKTLAKKPSSQEAKKPRSQATPTPVRNIKSHSNIPTIGDWRWFKLLDTKGFL